MHPGLMKGCKHMKFIDSIFDQTVGGLSKAMDLSWKKNQALTANIANAETPQYRAVDVSFGKELDRAFGGSNDTLARTDADHIDVQSDQSSLVEDLSGTEKADGNNVDIDIQMGRLAQNSWEYANAAKLIRRQIGLVRSAIRDGR